MQSVKNIYNDSTDCFKIMRIMNNISPVMSHQGIEYYVATSINPGAKFHFVAVDPLLVIMKYFYKNLKYFQKTSHLSAGGMENHVLMVQK